MIKKIDFNYNSAAREATLDIEGTIGYDWWSETPDENTKGVVKAKLRDIAETKAKLITVNIDSYGGDFNDAISIHDALALHPARIEVHISGMTASAATLISMAGDHVEMSPNSFFLPHKAWNGVMGNANEMRANAELLDKLDERQAKIYSAKTGESVDYHLDLMNRANGDGQWQDADEALSHGFIDSISEFTKAAASAPSEKTRAELRLPKFNTNKTKNVEDNKVTPEVQEELKGINKMLATLKDLVTPKAPEASAEGEETKPTAEEVNAQLTEKITNLEAELATSKTDLETEKTAKADLDTKITALETSVAELSKTISGEEIVAGAQGGADEESGLSLKERRAKNLAAVEKFQKEQKN